MKVIFNADETASIIELAKDSIARDKNLSFFIKFGKRDIVQLTEMRPNIEATLVFPGVQLIQED